MVGCCKLLSLLFHSPAPPWPPSLPHKAAAEQQSWSSEGPVQGLSPFLAKDLHAQTRKYFSLPCLVLAGGRQGLCRLAPGISPVQSHNRGKATLSRVCAIRLQRQHEQRAQQLGARELPTHSCLPPVGAV